MILTFVTKDKPKWIWFFWFKNFFCYCVFHIIVNSKRMTKFVSVVNGYHTRHPKLWRVDGMVWSNCGINQSVNSKDGVIHRFLIGCRTRFTNQITIIKMVLYAGFWLVVAAIGINQLMSNNDCVMRKPFELLLRAALSNG